jgi:hypothetical protein
MGINDLRDESADIRVHPVALFEKDAAILSIKSLTVEDWKEPHKALRRVFG